MTVNDGLSIRFTPPGGADTKQLKEPGDGPIIPPEGCNDGRRA
jgi:hypothetical protein